MTEELDQLLHNLKLHRMHAVYDEQLRAADQQQITYTDFIAGLLRAQWRDRQENALESRILRAGLPERWALETFPFAKQPGVNRKQIRAFAELDFVAKHENLASAKPCSLRTSVLAGRSVLFRPAAALLEDLHRQSPEGRRRRLRTYANVDLLCIDEVGYLSFDDKAADLLYEVVNRRYERKSLIITTNRPFKEWNEVFPNATCIATLLDRLLHHADATVIEGASYRIRESEQETAARRRKKP